MIRVVQHPSGGSIHGATIASGLSSISVSWGSATHRGNVRQLNEDSLLIAAPLFLVADGMGGHEGGDVASALAVGVMAALSHATTEVDRNAIVEAVTRANTVIHEQSGGGERGMGTTLTGVVVAGSRRGGDVAVVNVGDSRTYRLRSNVLEQMTTDHSHVQELIDAGLIAPSDAASHPQRNVVTRALGIDPFVEVDVIATPVVGGDRFLICSDGLSGELDLATMTRLLAIGDAQTAADALVTATLQGEARDNVTVIVVDVQAIAIAVDDDRTDPRGAVTLVSGTRSADITDRRTREEPTLQHGQKRDRSPSAGLISAVPVSTPELQSKAEIFTPPSPNQLIDGVPSPIVAAAKPDDTVDLAVHSDDAPGGDG